MVLGARERPRSAIISDEVMVRKLVPQIPPDAVDDEVAFKLAPLDEIVEGRTMFAHPRLFAAGRLTSSRGKLCNRILWLSLKDWSFKIELLG
jgi:hypothetical protein